ncbi:MAG: hypothetical protein APR53_06290 [Methanoculleus sp. SDB]|nr:MAG: hypothetical protein APR53_06290 [Methanoculleus sp. SDB]
MKAQRNSKKPDSSPNYMKIGALFILVICVAGFTLNMGFFSAFKTAQPGNAVALDFTLRDESGLAVLTSNQQVMKNALETGEGVLVTQPISLNVGGNVTEDIVSVDAYVSDGTRYYPIGKYALLSFELETISDACEGMRQNERKRVSFEYPESPVWTLSVEEFENFGGNFSTTNLGDWVPLGFSTAPIIAVDNTTPEVPFRLTKVVDKQADSIDIRYGYAYADIILSEMAG